MRIETSAKWMELMAQLFLHLSEHESATIRSAVETAQLGHFNENLDAHDRGMSLQTILTFVRSRARMISAGDLMMRTEARRTLAALRGLVRMHALRGRKPRVKGPSRSKAVMASLDTQTAAVDTIYHWSVGRLPSVQEHGIWQRNFANGTSVFDFIVGMASSPEARRRVEGMTMSDLSDGEYVQLVYLAVENRYPRADWIEKWRGQLLKGMSRPDLVAAIAQFAIANYALPEFSGKLQPPDGHSFGVMGTTRLVRIDDWRRRAEELKDEKDEETKERPKSFPTRFYIKSKPAILVSAIASMYKGGKFIKAFLDNMIEQTIFPDYMELIIIDANSPDGEGDVIRDYADKHKHIVYKRMDYTIGIYDAWNVGVEVSRGKYLTNTNLDDLRRVDSLELQASILENLQFVDVVYQDFHYSMDPTLTFEEISRFAYTSDLPVITTQNLMEFNSPHNAPMWRKSLHEELGKFDTSFKSAGDYEFWMRCLAAGKTFYKCNDPHVIYYHNPKGLSTRPDTRGVEEVARILKLHGRKLVHEAVTCDIDRFTDAIGHDLDDGLGQGSARYAIAQRALRHLSMKTRRAQGTVR